MLETSSPWRLVTCDCPLFAQSKQLRHRSITGEWMTALFDELTARPRDTIYSIAFALTFLPLHDLTGREGDDADTSRFVAARELFDLLDDSLRLDDNALSFDQLQRSRAVSLDAFVRANGAYVKSIETRRELSERLDRRNRQRRRRRRLRRDIESNAQPLGPLAGPIEFDLSDKVEIRRVLQTLRDETRLPLPVNVVCSRVLTKQEFNVDGLLESIIRDDDDDEDDDDDDDGEQSSGRPADENRRHHRYLENSSTTIDSQEAASRSIESFSPEHMFLRYAPVAYRYEALQMVIEEIERTRNVRITRIYLPHMSAWQSGSSQLLWIMMHTLAALSVERRNVYLMRFMVLLQNMSFFVWCSECAAHWRDNLGDEFFAQLDRLAENTKHQLPIDLVLMRVHNQIAFNTNRPLSSWTVGQLVLDYREFVRRVLTKPAASMCNRPHISAWWTRRRQWRSRRSASPWRRPAPNENQLAPRLILRDDCKQSQAYDRETYEPFYMRDQSPLELVDSLVVSETSSSSSPPYYNDEVIKRALGDWLLYALWRSVSTNAPIGGTI